MTEVLPSALVAKLELLFAHREQDIIRDLKYTDSAKIAKFASQLVKDDLLWLRYEADALDPYEVKQLNNPLTTVLASIHWAIIEIDESLYTRAEEGDPLPMIYEELERKIDEIAAEALEEKKINGRSWRNFVFSSTFSKDCEQVLGR